MTDREKLFELIKGAFDKCCSVQCEGCEYEDEHVSARWCQSRMFADFLIANGVTFVTDTNVGSKWISVEDRLPENRNDVLVCAFWEGEWCTLLAWYGTNGRRWHVLAGVVEKTDLAVSHWMPLPEPPKEG